MSEAQSAKRFNAYGWVMVVVAALAMWATLPGRTHGLGMITERLLADPAFAQPGEFGLGRVSFADMNLWATLLGGLFCLPCGYLIDRYGLKLNLTITVAALGLAVLGMTWAQGWWALFAMIALTRGFGQSALSVISITIVGKWFKGRNSFPMAVYTLLLGLGFAYTSQLAKPYANSDWRVLWGGIGWILLLGMAPVSLLLARDPKLEPNRAADPQDDPAKDSGLLAREPGFTLTQAMATPAFWMFGLAISLIALIGTGSSLFNESVLKQQGFDKQVYYDLFTVTGLVGMAAKLPIGWLGQYCSLGRLHAVGLALMAGCLLWLPHIHTKWELYLYGAGMGISGAITTILFFTIWGQAYGRPHLGQIQSVAQMLTVLASASGPKVFAEVFERYDSYAPAFQVLAGLLGLLAVWSAVVHVPSPTEAPQENPLPLTLNSTQEIPA